MKKVILISLLLFTSIPSLKSGTVIHNVGSHYNINYKNLYNKLLETGIMFPDIAFAQALLESGHFKSSLFKRANNLFGMQYPTKRETTAYGRTNGYSKFVTWHHSVIDYKLWQDSLFKRKGKMNRQQYLAYIDRWYAEDGLYVNKVKNKIKRYNYVFQN